MAKVCVIGVLLAAGLMSGCAFENSSTLFNPAAPSETAGTTSLPAIPSVFNGSWGSSTIAGLPLGTCADVKWVITAQTNNQIAGTVTASCASGVGVSANLTGTLAGADRMNLAAHGTLSAMGLPCAFTLNGTGTRASNDTMRVDYTGTYCFGNVSGTENLKRFPDV